MKPIAASIQPWILAADAQQQFFRDRALAEKELNGFDPAVLNYPGLGLALAADDTGPFLAFPIQTAFFFESIATVPDLGHKKEALALAKLGKLMDDVANAAGIREQYFFCRDDRVCEIVQRHGWEEMKGFRLMRRRVPAP